MKHTRQAYLLLGLWLLTLAAGGWYIQQHLVVSADLRWFMPEPTTPTEELLLKEIGEGPASRVLIIALDGGTTEQLADASRELATQLTADPQFRFVSNGTMALENVPEELLPYRFLLSSTLDNHRLDAPYLREQLESRAQDLASPAGDMLEPLLPRDPTLELVKLLDSWRPMQEPARQYDVWFDRAGRRALMLAETKAPAFDSGGQKSALSTIQSTFESLDKPASVTMTVSGTGAFSAYMEQRISRQAQALGIADAIGVLLLLIIAYRSVPTVLLSALPLASAGIAATFVVSALFGTIHGITLAFGVTLLGIAQDYPLHLLSHQHPGITPLNNARTIWPTLATGVASTCIAYLAFLASGVRGLEQVACFTIAGLATAGLTTRYLLPRVLDANTRDYGKSTWLDHLWHRITSLPRPRWAGALIVIASAAVVAFAPWPLWQNDLSKLTPVPQELLDRNLELQSSLGTPSVRYLLVLMNPDSATALKRLEALDGDLKQLVAQGVVGGYDHLARYVPSEARQLARQARLPDNNELESALTQALEGSPFRAGVFEPFLQDVELARTLAPLTPEKLQSSPFGAQLEQLLGRYRDRTAAFVTFSGVKKPEALQAFAQRLGNDVTLLDIKAAAEGLVAHQRTRILWSLGVAAILLTAVVLIALRSRERALRVLAPMTLTTFLLVGVLHGAGISLTLFHLISLVLAAGLGLDYALFFEHVSEDPEEQRRTLHAVLVCAASTLITFLLLAFAEVPLLHAIGTTVSLGVASNFVLALLLTRPRSTVRQTALAGEPA
jgi:predicted exporter